MIDPTEPIRASRASALSGGLRDLYARAAAEVQERARRSGDAHVLAHWGAGVTSLTLPAMQETARAVAGALWTELGGIGSPPDKIMDGWLAVAAAGRGDGWVEVTNETLRRATRASLPEILEAIINGAGEDARNAIDDAASFGSHEAAKKARATHKTWHLGPSGRHRASHVALAGSTVAMGDRFGNGLAYPRAPGPVEERINCSCWLTYQRDGADL